MSYSMFTDEGDECVCDAICFLTKNFSPTTLEEVDIKVKEICAFVKDQGKGKLYPEIKKS